MTSDHPKPRVRTRAKPPARVRVRTRPTQEAAPVTETPKPRMRAKKPTPTLTGDRIERGGDIPADALRVGVTGVRMEVGYVLPDDGKGRRAYLRHKNGNRKLLGRFTNYTEAHRAVVSAAHH